MSELAKRGGDIPGIAVDSKEKAERDTRWVGEWSDDLTIAIALKEWGKAVDLVEKGILILPPLRSLYNFACLQDKPKSALYRRCPRNSLS